MQIVETGAGRVRVAEPRLQRLGVLHERDARLLAALTAVHELRSAEDVTVAVVYGAAHMRAALRGLGDRLGYRVRAVEWLTVVGRPRGTGVPPAV
jgi:hypothetical protein